jgi:hypothetical protein
VTHRGKTEGAEQKALVLNVFELWPFRISPIENISARANFLTREEQEGGFQPAPINPESFLCPLRFLRLFLPTSSSAQSATEDLHSFGFLNVAGELILVLARVGHAFGFFRPVGIERLDAGADEMRAVAR